MLLTPVGSGLPDIFLCQISEGLHFPQFGWHQKIFAFFMFFFHAKIVLHENYGQSFYLITFI